MTPREAHRLREAIALKRAQLARTSSASYVPHTPHAKQQAFLSLDCLEALYGGAAGGGKSDALLMAALQYAHVPGYAALILRRTFQDLMRADAIMARAAEWLRPTAAKWVQDTKTWHFPSGATLSFGYFDTARDRDAYQGGAWQFIAFDETTQFPEAWYLYLFSRLRKTHQNVPLRMRSASNPGGIGHDWVYRRFIDPGTPGAPFIPATLADNPHVDAKSYRESLEKLDAVTRKQLLDGVWVRDSGGLVYGSFDETRNLIEVCPKLDFQLLAMDYGTTNATSFTRIGWRQHDPCVYIAESYKDTGMIPSGAAQEAKDLEKQHKFVRMIGDLGGLGKAYGQEAVERFGVPIEAADKNNKRGYIKLFNGELERGHIKVVRSACEPLIAEWKNLPWTEDLQKEVAGFDNHCADGALYGWRAAPAFHERVPGPPPTAEERAVAEEARMVEQLEMEAEREIRGEWWET